MRTAAICPTCATYENALCIIYNGSYLSNIDLAPLDNVQLAFSKVNTVLGTTEYVTNKVTSLPNFLSNTTSIVKYPSVKVVNDFVQFSLTNVVYTTGTQLITGQKVFNPDKLAIKNLTNGEIATFSYSGTTDATQVIFPVGVPDSNSDIIGTVVYQETLPKQFIATISYEAGSGNSPTLTVIKNTFSGTITAAWQNAVGSFSIQNSLPEFTTKTAPTLNSSGDVAKDLGATRNSTTSILLFSRNASGALADVLNNDVLKIETYP